MQEKVVFDTFIYIDLFNQEKYKNEFSGFEKIIYMAHPVLHELWMEAKGKKEINHLRSISKTFIKLKRLIKPYPKTQLLIGIACQKLYASGLLYPKNPRIYNDICIALLTRQIGATLITKNIRDFKVIQEIYDFKFRLPAT
jgi:predicted nucleic acid-binding protein